ncbi:MAG: heat-inducible transcriptional repressor HrcA [Clostridiales bacterium]|jgi:heat-inducible transcriptional repressor|nr:heat-inducible transcriptional repressor HrcA [Clostridiales bacterium]
MLKLNLRKIRILEAIINDYIAHAEPIGSRTIAKKYDLGISSATIRNEMSDLEEMGYIVAPHASSGRVPSDKGYRLYVDEVMPNKRLPQEHQEYLQQSITQNLSHIDLLMRDLARAISFVTNYTTVAADFLAKRHKIKHIQLVPVGESTFALMLITDLKAVKNRVLALPRTQTVGNATAGRISAELTKILADADADDLSNKLYLGRTRQRFYDMHIDPDFAEPLIAAIVDALSSADNVQIYIGGVKNILEFPEFANVDKARAVVGALEEKDGLITLLADNSEEIQIIIGAENKNVMLKDCSVIKAKIRINEHFYGNIAIIGPTRMDYSQAVSVLQNMAASNTERRV